MLKYRGDAAVMKMTRYGDGNEEMTMPTRCHRFFSFLMKKGLADHANGAGPIRNLGHSPQPPSLVGARGTNAAAAPSPWVRFAKPGNLLLEPGG